MSGNVTPSNIDAEMAVISSVLIDPDMLPEVRQLISEKDFYNERNRTTFKILCDLYEQQMPFDTFIFLDEAKKQNVDDIVTAMDYAGYNTVASGIYAMHYAEFVKDSSVRRRRWMMGQELVSKIYKNIPTAEIEEWLRAEVLGVVVNNDGVMEWEQSFILEDELEELYATPQHAEQLESWSMPWASWSRFISPAEKGILITVAAPDGVGKTLVGEHFAEHWARMGKHGVYVHFELSKKTMVDRRTCRYASIDYNSLITDNLSPDERKRRDAAKQYVRNWEGSITYLHTPRWTIDMVVNKLRMLHKQGKCDFVIVEYLEKAQASTRQAKLFNNPYQREADDVEILKSFSESEDYGCRMVMLSQFGKEGKETPFKELTRTKIRGAGEKTEKANVVVLLHKEISPGQLDKQTGKWIIEPGSYDAKLGIVIDKNTLGRTARFTDQETTPFFSIYDKQ